MKIYLEMTLIMDYWSHPHPKGVILGRSVNDKQAFKNELSKKFYDDPGIYRWYGHFNIMYTADSKTTLPCNAADFKLYHIR